MANNWNPNAPDVLGLEWPLTSISQENIQQATPFATRLRSTAAETITNLQLRMLMNSGDTRPLFTLVDIMPVGSELAGTVQTVDYAPNADSLISDWTTNTGGLTNLYQRIDDPVQFPPVGTDYIKTITGPTGYECEIASAGFSATRRVVRLRVAAVIGAQTGFRQFQFRIYHVASASYFSPAGANLWGSGFGTIVDIDFGEINPVTALPWTPTDIQGFDSGVWRLRVEAVGTAGNYAAVHCMALRVQYVTTENRVAVGTWPRPTDGSSPTSLTTAQLVTMPAGTANWSKPSSGDFTFLWRKAYDLLRNPGQATANDVQWIAARAEAPGIEIPSPVPGMSGIKLPVSNQGLVTGAGTPYLGRAGVLALNTAIATSNDSQPYTVTDRLAAAGESVGQRMTPGATDTYLGVRLIGGPDVDGAGTLTVTVHRVSDDVQMGGSLTFDAPTSRALPALAAGSDLRSLEGFLSAGAALVSGTQYEVRFTVSNPGVTWRFSLPSTSFGATATFGGTTDCAVDPPAVLSGDDFAVMLLVQPDAPATAAADAVEVQTPGDGCYCSVESIDAIKVSWEATSEGLSFTRYEVERQELDDTAPWVPLAVIVDESVIEFTDYETPRGTQARYRVRVIISTGAFSEWVVTDWVQARARKCEVIFTSNARPELAVAYDREPDVSYEYLSHRYDVLLPIYGADYQVAFSETEDRGVAFDMAITANFGRQPTDATSGDRIGGVRVFEPLAQIAHPRPPIPYVCILDADGNRFYAHIAFDVGRNREPGWRYHATVAVTQIAGTPTVTELPGGP